MPSDYKCTQTYIHVRIYTRAFSTTLQAKYKWVCSVVAVFRDIYGLLLLLLLLLLL